MNYWAKKSKQCSICWRILRKKITSNTPPPPKCVKIRTLFPKIIGFTIVNLQIYNSKYDFCHVFLDCLVKIWPLLQVFFFQYIIVVILTGGIFCDILANQKHTRISGKKVKKVRKNALYFSRNLTKTTFWAFFTSNCSYNIILLQIAPKEMFSKGVKIQ